ncbi:hypothetical protein M758_3G091800 [Ceratodon purpureus]|uniref:RNA helicase n=1 Tax=Ceratodon purpureus TaxID=3225 RepID=A0A8T0IK72_CERPU|nr:hypothetical protein KC19_3G089800 [Ceratodon purpureus]KAG0622357.1 hypothetical protein M758_3G091800 [Ceratodon purpureus]
MVGAAVAAAPRYAPADPTLPPPWRALVDGNTGYIYYWNPETNITQYDKPLPLVAPGPPLPSGPPPSSVISGPKLAAIPNGTEQLNGGSGNGHMAGLNGYHGHGVGAMPNQQPKLAAIPVPRGAQAPVGQAISVAASNSMPGSSASMVMGGLPGGQKHNGNTYDNADRDGYYKRPRVEAYANALTSDIDSYRKQHEVSALGENVPAPFMSFEAVGFPPDMLRELQAAGFKSPTPIQAQSWPIAMQNRDIVAIAKTGSGKTLGYLIPAFLHLEQHRSNSRLGPTVLVLAPTRELATQIQDECVKFGRSSRITSTCVYGGAPKGPQLRDIERGADIVIATPGRLNDFLEVKKVSLRQVSYLVLDEADRMLDMGFEPQIRKIVNEIPARRQTLMYTATWPKEVRKIAGDLLINPVQVNIGNTDELSANKSITQHVEVVVPYEKQRRVEQILRSQENGSKIIIFCSTKRMCDTLSRNLSREFGAAAIHGDKSQSERDYVLSQFRTGRVPILVATDVAARGLDIKDIRVVVNYDFPTGVEDYVHRIGRTGRAGATGLAYTFFSEQDGKYAKDLIKVLEGANQKVPPELKDISSRGGGMFKGRMGNRWGGDGGGRGGRDGGRSSYGGRGDFGGRGSYGGRDGGGRDGGRFESRDRYSDRLGSDRHDRYSAPDGGRYGDKDKSKNRSRSYSRSPSRSRAYSRSRSRSYDRFSDDRGRDRSRSPAAQRSYSPARSGRR